MLLEELLSVVGSVERVAVGITPRTCVIAADDQVTAAEVLADDGVEQRLSRPAHPHRQRQQSEHRGIARVAAHETLIAAHAGVVIDVSGLGHPDHRMDEQVRLHFPRGTQGELKVGPVHRIAGLEGDDPAPSQALEPTTQVRGSGA